jgi:hypothetical protein
MGKDVEGSGSGLIQVLSQHLSGGTQENHERTQNRLSRGRDSNRSLPNKSTAVTARPTCSVREERMCELHECSRNSAMKAVH